MPCNDRYCTTSFQATHAISSRVSSQGAHGSPSPQTSLAQAPNQANSTRLMHDRKKRKKTDNSHRYTVVHCCREWGAGARERQKGGRVGSGEGALTFFSGVRQKQKHRRKTESPNSQIQKPGLSKSCLSKSCKPTNLATSLTTLKPSPPVPIPSA